MKILSAVLVLALPLPALAQAGINEWSAATPMPTAAGSGAAIAALPNDEDIYVLIGGDTGTFYHYSVAKDAWASLRGIFSAGEGSMTAMTAGPNGCLYAIFPGPIFARYNTANESWQMLQEPLDHTSVGLAWNGGDYIYGSVDTMPGTYQRYSIPLMSWELLENVGPDVAAGASSAFHSSNFFAITGGGSTTFSAGVGGLVAFLASTPSPVWVVSSLCAGPDGTLFALAGGGAGAFWSYDIAGNRWTIRQNPPEAPTDGTGIAWPGSGNYLYGLPGKGSTAFWKYRFSSDPPDAPTQPLQVSRSGSPLSAGATTEVAFEVRAVVSDMNGDDCQIEVEVKPVGSAFNGTTGLASGVLVGNGQAASVTVEGLARGAGYHWRVRAIDATGTKSPWTVFGSDPMGIDITLAPDRAPVVSGARQARPGTGAILALGERLLNPGMILFQAEVHDPDMDSVSLQVEARPVGDALRGEPTAASAFAAEGGTATAAAAVEDGPIHWQYRFVDALGLATAWTSFGGNAESKADFDLIPAGSKGPSGCTGSAAGLAALLPLVGILALVARRR